MTALEASLELARKRVAQNTELAATGAGNRFDLEQAQTTATELANQIAAGRAAQQQIREKLSGRVGKEFAAVAGVKSQITTAQDIQASRAQVEMIRAHAENARWNLAQTIVLPLVYRQTMVNVMLRPGYFVSGVASPAPLTFVDSQYQVFAMFSQNELTRSSPHKKPRSPSRRTRAASSRRMSTR